MAHFRGVHRVNALFIRYHVWFSPWRITDVFHVTRRLVDVSSSQLSSSARQSLRETRLLRERNIELMNKSRDNDRFLHPAGSRLFLRLDPQKSSRISLERVAFTTSHFIVVASSGFNRTRIFDIVFICICIVYIDRIYRIRKFLFSSFFLFGIPLYVRLFMRITADWSEKEYHSIDCTDLNNLETWLFIHAASYFVAPIPGRPNGSST